MKKKSTKLLEPKEKPKKDLGGTKEARKSKNDSSFESIPGSRAAFKTPLRKKD